MMKIMFVFGTRPEAIKMAPIIKEVEKHPDKLARRILVTAQHRQMLDQVLKLFDVEPDYDLDIMRESQSPAQVAAKVLSQLEPVLWKEKPEWVLVQGDTTTVAAASLAAFYSQIKIGHVEAGLRTHNRLQPYPEEINRRVTGVIADLHFAPTNRARINLRRERVPDKQIFITGNPVIDALHWVIKQPFDTTRLNVPKGKKKLILVTAHRRENFGEPLADICLALRQIARKFRNEIHIVYPVHLNPNVTKPVQHFLQNIPNISLLPPLDYESMVHLMKMSTLILTDSGGIQEEAPSLGKPVLVLREITERPEAVETGSVKVVGTDAEKIIAETSLLLENNAEYQRMSMAVNPYGDGLAAWRIVNALLGNAMEPFQPRFASTDMRLAG